MERVQSARPEERKAVPRVQHLGYFDAGLHGVQAGMTFDEIRLHLATVARDLARYAGRPGRRGLVREETPGAVAGETASTNSR